MCKRWDHNTLQLEKYNPRGYAKRILELSCVQISWTVISKGVQPHIADKPCVHLADSSRPFILAGLSFSFITHCHSRSMIQWFYRFLDTEDENMTAEHHLDMDETWWCCPVASSRFRWWTSVIGSNIVHILEKCRIWYKASPCFTCTNLHWTSAKYWAPPWPWSLGQMAQLLSPPLVQGSADAVWSLFVNLTRIGEAIC